MNRKEIQNVFSREGYRFFYVRPEEIEVFYKYKQEVCHAVMVVYARSEYPMGEEQHRVLADQVKSVLYHPQEIKADIPGDLLVRNVELLTLLVGEYAEQMRMLCASGENIWGYLASENRLLIYENQPGDFQGLRLALETKPAVFCPYITIGIVALNLLVFLLLEWIGDTEDALFIATHGGMHPLFLRYHNEWWRILTAGFIHFGVSHLANNMLILALLGSRLERIVGHIRMAVIYFLSLISGGVLSYAVMLHAQDYAVSGGASGAVFGVIGAMLWIVIWHRGRFEGMTAGRYALMIGLSLYYGFASINIDNWAHIGGVLAGFVICAILYHQKGAKS